MKSVLIKKKITFIFLSFCNRFHVSKDTEVIIVLSIVPNS